MNDHPEGGFAGAHAMEPLARPQGFESLRTLYYETAFATPDQLEIYAYTDRLSYNVGDELVLHASSTAASVTIEIWQDGVAPKLVHRFEPTSVPSTPTPEDFHLHGCRWPAVAKWQIPADAANGLYLVRCRASGSTGDVRDYDHLFFVKRQAPSSKLLLIAATSTWIAYNDWGGRNHYVAPSLPETAFAPQLSILRPWARGFVWLPANAPRKVDGTGSDPNAPARYPYDEFAFARGYSRFYASAGWASYDRLFFTWAQAQGYAPDIVSQHDLHREPEILDGYPCVAFVGHDEYWSREMRLAIERYVEGGGRVCRLAGNFFSQIRLEENLTRQVCYKELAATHDPVAGTDDAARLTTLWDDPVLDWPSEQTFGLSAIFGIYAGIGRMAQRGAGGFTVYRPDHWAFAGLGLGYGDVIGGHSRIFGYEVDGLDYRVIDGLPVPTERMRTPETLEILAMGLASNIETAADRKGETLYLGDAECRYLAHARYGQVEGKLESASRGCGMIVAFSRGRGEVFHAGTCDWVAGLQRRDPVVEGITRRVLDRFCGG